MQTSITWPTHIQPKHPREHIGILSQNDTPSHIIHLIPHHHPNAYHLGQHTINWRLQWHQDSNCYWTMLPHKNIPGSQHILHCPVDTAPPSMHPNDWIISHQSHTTLYPKNHMPQPIQLDPIALDFSQHTPQPPTEFDYQRWILPFPSSFLPPPHSADTLPYKPHKIYRGARKHPQSEIHAYLAQGLTSNHPGYIPYTQTMQLLTWLNEHMPIHVVEEYPNNNPHRPAKIHRRIWTEQNIESIPIFGIYLGDGTNMPIYQLNNKNLHQRFHGILIPNPMDFSLEGAFTHRPTLPTTAPKLSQHETIKHLRHIRAWASEHTPDILNHLFPQHA